VRRREVAQARVEGMVAGEGQGGGEGGGEEAVVVMARRRRSE